MKKIYKEPQITAARFSVESILTASAKSAEEVVKDSMGNDVTVKTESWSGMTTNGVLSFVN